MKITGAATVLPVTDIGVSLRFYVNMLGFKEVFRYPNYAGIEREECTLHLSHESNPNTGEPGTGTVYIFCDEVDEFYRQLIERGAKLNSQPKDYAYGMRDFVIDDPDGNRLTFGAPSVKN
jgi:catechol 2,3-dioxygenase-like lactoylglutathione lyase family enzyme